MKDRYAILLLILMGLIFYSLTLRGVLGNPKPEDFKNNLDQATKPLELSPERGRFAGTLALAEFHTYDLGQKLADAVYPDVGVYQGKFFSFFAPGVSYLALPFYLLGRHFNLSLVGTFGFVSILTILNLVLIFLIARRILKLPSWAAFFAAMIFGFGSTAWDYAITLYQHQFTVFFILSSFYAVWKFKEQKNFSWLWSLWVWLAYGLAITVDYPNAVLLLPIIVYLLIVSFKTIKVPEGIKLWLRPAVVLTLVGLFIIFGWNVYHNSQYFGSWKNISSQLPAYRTVKQTGSSTQDSTAAVAKLTQKQGLQNFFQETNIPFSFYTLIASPDRGVLVFSPIFLLAILGMFLLKGRLTLETAILTFLIGVNVFLYSSWGDPWGGWAYGPRYLIPSMAIMSLFAVSWLVKYNKYIWAKIFGFVLFAYSLAIALLGALTTNAVPPKIEAVNLPAKYYNFFYNLHLMKENKSSSIIFNNIFSHSMTLNTYFLILYVSLLVVAIFVLFIISKISHER